MAALHDLIERLNHHDEVERRMAMSSIREAGAAGAPLLTKALSSDPRPRVRSQAALLLGQVSGITDDAIEALAKALKDEAEEVRRAAADALGLIGKQAVPALITALQADEPDTQARAAIALGQIGRPAVQAGPSLAPLLLHEDDFVRLQSATALGRIGVADITPLVKALDVALDSNNARMAETIVIALRETGDRSDQVYTALAEGYCRGPECVRREALHGIRRIDPTVEVQQGKKSTTIKLPGRIVAGLIRKRGAGGQREPELTTDE
jgi:HEAT repeat protein